MSKQVKKAYRFLAWVFSILIASGALAGCRKPAAKYGPPTSKYGPPPVTSMCDNKIKGNTAQNE
ncbi:hypothetical protein JK636_16090 [Clostridium sp. YIM B02515]|uniref:Lipoprotein n=1 Tax=Clostridium rhizosphaerae TaxID=2803861 RepID=A0ABS1TG15_9CLOT|nr:hypothetical protein [Clostridium rhizosphaerae]MBL4937249.1 hypothetical protein [Clostridium rhizosphaerae]